MLFSRVYPGLIAVLPIVTAIPSQDFSFSNDSRKYCELGGAIVNDGNIGPTPGCNNCKTVNGIPAPTATPSGVPGNELDGDADLSNKKHKRALEAVPLLTINDIKKPKEEADEPDEVSLFKMLLSMTPDNVDNDIDITPTDLQIATWVIDGTPIGATGKWYPFGDSPQAWKMRGLSGCTAIFIVSSNGLWAGHLWESSGPDKINGGSSFKERINAKEVEDRPLSDFKKIAVDIMSQETPADQVANRQNWISLKDLETQKGNPFANGEDVDIFVLTRAASATSKAMMYPQQISALKRALVTATNNPPRGNYVGLTYPGEGDTRKLKYPILNGQIAIQYTPFDSVDPDDSCTPWAGLQIWVNPETEKEPAVKKFWKPLDGQKVSRRAVCSKAPTTTPTPTSSSSLITQAPSAAPSCQLHNQDPDQGITQAYCLCDKSITLSPLPATSAQSESCAYKSIPSATSASESVHTLTEVYTQNCAACTIVGGIADAATCTTVAGCTPTHAPSPTIAAWVANLSTVDIGNAEDQNGGKDLATEMYGKLRAMCNASTCIGDHAEMDNVEAAIADSDEILKPAMFFQDVSFSSISVLEKMLSVGISSWVSALNNPTLQLCKNVTYEAEADETGSGCGKGPIPTKRLRRKVRREDGVVLWERDGLNMTEESQLAERCLDDCDRPLVCHYAARMCNAPSEITVVMADNTGNPYANHLSIGLTLDDTSDGFSCEEVAAAITAAMVILAPELLEADAFEGVELETMCGVIDDPLSAIDGLTGEKAVGRRGISAN